MAAKPNILDPKAKAARQKKIAIVGFVLLLALLAFQVPRTMKMLHPKPIPRAQPTAPASTTPTPAPSTPTPSTTTPATAQPAATGSSAAGADALVVNADLSPPPLEGQLASFTRFTSKDPFQQQGKAAAAGSSKSPGSSGSTPKPAKPPVDANGGSAVPPGSDSSPPTPSAPPPVSAVLSINGVEEAVNVDADFPAAAPVFHLVALTAKTAKISIAGGSLASGAPTVTLELGKPVTLMNTADGTRYKVVLVSTSATGASTAAAASTSGTP